MLPRQCLRRATVFKFKSPSFLFRLAAGSGVGGLMVSHPELKTRIYGYSPSSLLWTLGKRHVITATESPASLASQTWCPTVALTLSCGGKLTPWEKDHCIRDISGHFQGQLTELMGITGDFCFSCYLSLVHKQAVKYSDSSDRANCANS
jgi:hypothetical protein